jgi:hypothetical protein
LAAAALALFVNMLSITNVTRSRKEKTVIAIKRRRLT